REWLVQLTKVDPSNFPRALVIFTGIALPFFWILLSTGGGLLLAVIYLVAHGLRTLIWGVAQAVRRWLGSQGTHQKPAPDLDRAMTYLAGMLGFFLVAVFLLKAVS